MSIYRGSGGSGDANTDATINEVTELVQDANQYKDEAATSASNAATSASNAATSESNASTSETNASSSASDAATSETNAATSETNAASSATSASTSASNASTSATAAQTAQTAAETAQASAETAETNASASATSASSSASTATTQAGIATTKASEASTSATNAATSETNAANSATSASTSATNAANSASTASTAASNASTSESNASTSETNAAASEASASSSASSASSSASSAAGSATTATTKASEAATSASNASTSETNAANSASAASTSATNAANSASAATSSATAAAASAANAAQSYDQFDDRYLGSKTSDPTLDNDGNALLTGALYFNSTASEMRIYDGGIWIPASSSTIETMDKYAFTATSGQTVFSGLDDNSNTLALTVGVEFVTLNGIVLEAGTDYTATTSSITLTAGASTGDELNVIAFGNFTVADVVSASTGGTFQDNIVVNGNVTATAFAGDGSALTGVSADAADVNYTATGDIVATDVQAAITELDTEKQTQSALLDDAVTENAIGRKNYIINGNFDIWQRGTSQTTSSYGSDDRWYNTNFISTKTVSQQAFALGQTDVPNNPKYYSRTTVASAAGTNSHAAKYQRIEGVSSLAGETVTLSFYAKADAPKNMVSEFAQMFGNGGTPSAAVYSIGVTTHALTTSWQRFTVTVALPSISGKTLGTDGNDNLSISLWFDADAVFDARTNSLGKQSGTFDIAQIQLEKGSVATDFEHRPISEELALCKRHFERINYVVSSYITAGQAQATSVAIADFNFSEKRVAPSISDNGNLIFGTANGTAASGSYAYNNINKKNCRIVLTGSSGLVAGNASMVSTTAATYIDLDSEL